MKIQKRKMSISMEYIWAQLYILPFVKVTHTRVLNGDYEFIIGMVEVATRYNNLTFFNIRGLVIPNLFCIFDL
jgi:hypothetical protein